MTIGIEHYITVSSILFVLGVLGIFLNRKNVIVILMAIELILLAVVLLSEMVFGLGAVGHGGIKLGTPDGSAAIPAQGSNVEAIGMLLYSKYLFLFEAAGIILLVAMVGAIVLTHRKRPGVRGQSVARQNARRPGEATVNMSPEVGQGVKL